MLKTLSTTLPFCQYFSFHLFNTIVVLLMSTVFLLGQNPEVDSLYQALANADLETDRISLMNELSSELIDIDHDASNKLAKNALKLSRSANDVKQEIKALHNLGILFYDSKADRDSAINYFVKGEQLARENNLKALQSDHLMRIANWFRYYEIDSAKTVNYLQKSVKISKEANYHFGTARSYAKLASFYTRHKETLLCEDYLELSKKYYLKIKNGEIEVAHYHDEVGNKIWGYNPKKSMDFYFEGLKYADNYPNLKVSLAKAYIAIGKPKAALRFLEEALTILETRPDPRIKGIAIAKIAEAHLLNNDYKSALSRCEEGISFLLPYSLSNRSGLPSLYRTKADLLVLEKNEKVAIEYYEKSIAEGTNINEYYEVLKSNISLGKICLKNNLSKGLHYCNVALKGAEEDNYSDIEIDACDCLYNISKEKNQHANALKYFERKEALNESLNTLRVEHALEVAQKDQQLALEEIEKERKDDQIGAQKRVNNIFRYSSLTGLFLMLFLVSSLAKIRTQNKEIKLKTVALENVNTSLANSNEDLERFAYVASHDLKSPINTIVNFNKLIRNDISKAEYPKVHTYVDLIETAGNRMTQLIKDILEYAKLSNKDSSDALEVVDLNKLVNEITQLATNGVGNKSVSITNDLPKLKWQYSKIYLLFKNLIENGLKYNESENPIVKLSYTRQDGKHFISITDNGIGIKKEYHEKIFLMFERLHSQSNYEGTGLGLATCKKIIDDFNGNIEITSEEGQGTRFTIHLPSEIVGS